jgi:adenylosuccinate synthase
VGNNKINYKEIGWVGVGLWKGLICLNTETSWELFKLDVHGTVHHSKIHEEKSNKMQQCNTVPDNVHQLRVQQPATYEKPEVASAVLGSWWWAVCRPKHVEFHINME